MACKKPYDQQSRNFAFEFKIFEETHLQQESEEAASLLVFLLEARDRPAALGLESGGQVRLPMLEALRFQRQLPHSADLSNKMPHIRSKQRRLYSKCQQILNNISYLDRQSLCDFVFTTIKDSGTKV